MERRYRETGSDTMKQQYEEFMRITPCKCCGGQRLKKDVYKRQNILAAKLAEAGIHNIAVYDVSNTHVSTLISEAFRCSHIVLAAPTYNGNVYPVMENFLNDMKALAVQKRTVAILDNGTWAATAGKQMADKITEMKDMKIIEPKVSIKSSLKNEQLEQLDELVAEIKKDF